MALDELPSRNDNTTLAHQTQAEKVRVDLQDRSYDILIGSGLVENAGTLIAAQLRTTKCAVITDENVATHHLPALRDSLLEHDLFAGSIVLPAGEKTKSFANLEHVCSELLSLGLERGDLVIAFGGGVIGDLAGFAAAILRRGIRFIQIPTSLLAQVDSSVGGKTGINTAHGKNLIGSFHQPSLVLADTATLNTLDERQLRAGYAEVVKYALIGDTDFFHWLQHNRDAILRYDGKERTQAIKTSCRAKSAIVAQDERETGNRALLNLGHTFGHALETWAGYSDKLLHGEAISIGMVLAFDYSEKLGLCSSDEAVCVAAHFKQSGLPTSIRDIPGGEYPVVDELMTLMAQDKKVKDGKMIFILAKSIGEAFIASNVDPDHLRDFLIDKI